MTYARLEDSFRDHPRFLEMSCAAVGMWASSLAYCNKHMTDGRVPSAAIGKLAPKESPTQRKKILQELLDTGAWELNDDGSYLVHDYLDWNDSKSKILTKREADRVRKESARNPHGQTRAVHADNPAPSTWTSRGVRSDTRALPHAGPGAGATDGHNKQTEQSDARTREGRPDSEAAPPKRNAEKLAELAAVFAPKAVP